MAPTTVTLCLTPLRPHLLYINVKYEKKSSCIFPYSGISLYFCRKNIVELCKLSLMIRISMGW